MAKIFGEIFGRRARSADNHGLTLIDTDKAQSGLIRSKSMIKSKSRSQGVGEVEWGNDGLTLPAEWNEARFGVGPD